MKFLVFLFSAAFILSTDASGQPSKYSSSTPPRIAILNDVTIEAHGSFTGLGGDYLAAFDEGKGQYLGGGASLKWNIPLALGFSMQVDGSGEFTENNNKNDCVNAENFCNHDYENSFMGGIHLSARDPERHLIGLFAGSAHSDTGENGRSLAYFLGGEAQVYSGRNTYYAQLGYIDGSQYDCIDYCIDGVFASSFFARLQWYNYLTDNIRTSIGLQYAIGRVDQDPNTDLFNVTGEFEYSLSNRPLSVFAAYHGSYYDQEPSDKMLEHVVLVGIRYSFSSTSLFERDRLGAGLDLPNFGRWLGNASGPIE